MDKITADMVEDWEKDQLLEAIGCEIELNDLFLERYCNEEFQELMRDIPEHDRGYVISGIDCKAWFNGSPSGNNDQHIWLNVAEIEFQFEGDPIDVFEDPDDFTINDDLAYLCVGYGLSIEYNQKELRESVEWYKENFTNED